MKIAYAASVRASESAAESMGVRSSSSYFEISSDADGIGAAYTVPAYWNRLQRDLVVSEELNLGDSARMFALVAMATADAIITCWDTKIHYNVWRPITAIREGDTTAIPKRLATPPGRRSSPPRTILTTPRARTMYRQQRRPFSRTCSATRWRFIRIPRPYRPEPATAMMLPCVR